jgi:hypothetical protein
MIRRFGGGTRVLIGVAAFGAGFIASVPARADAGRTQRHAGSVMKHRVRADAGHRRRLDALRAEARHAPRRIRFASYPVHADDDRTQADTGGDHGNGHGNGTRNRNIFSVRSPTNNHGYQHTSTSTAGGRTSVQNGLCTHVVICNITQQAGGKPAEPQPEAVPAVPPAPQVVPVPQAPPPQPPRPPAPNFGPFMYIGPLGFMFMVPPSLFAPEEPAARPAADPPVRSDDRRPVTVEEPVQPVE